MTATLDRFHTAQAQPGAGFDAALAELRAGAKRGHWIWYIFPQLDGLGSSPMSRSYALAGMKEAAEYLRDPVLRARLLAATTAIVEQLQAPHPVRLIDLMGSEVDVRKLVSSLTLFGPVATSLESSEGLADVRALADAAAVVLDAAAAQGFRRCRPTLDRLAAGA